MFFVCLQYYCSTGPIIFWVQCPFTVMDFITNCKMCGGLFAVREVGFVQTLCTLSRGRTVLAWLTFICIIYIFQANQVVENRTSNSIAILKFLMPLLYTANIEIIHSSSISLYEFQYFAMSMKIQNGRFIA